MRWVFRWDSISSHLHLFAARGSAWLGDKRDAKEMAALLSKYAHFVRLRPALVDALLARGYTSTIVKGDSTLLQEEGDETANHEKCARGVLLGACYFLNCDRKSMLAFVDRDDDDGEIGVEANAGRGRGARCRYMSEKTREVFACYGDHQEAHWTRSL